MADLFSCCALKIVILDDIFDDLPLRVMLIREDIGECNSWRIRLVTFWGRVLLLLLLVALAFLPLTFS